MHTELCSPVLIDILDLVDLLLDALTGHAVGLQLVHLLVDQVGDGFVEILQEVLDHLWDDVVGLLLVLPLVGQVSFGVTCNVGQREGDVNAPIHVSKNTCIGATKNLS